VSRDDERSIVVAVVAALIILLAAITEAHADDPGYLKIGSPSTLTTEKGSVVKLPPGRFIDEPTFALLDLEVRRLQERETRLAAENKSLRETATSSRIWKFTVAALAIGFASGVAVQVARQ